MAKYKKQFTEWDVITAYQPNEDLYLMGHAKPPNEVPLKIQERQFWVLLDTSYLRGRCAVFTVKSPDS